VTEYDFYSPSDVKKEDYILVNEKALFAKRRAFGGALLPERTRKWGSVFSALPLLSGKTGSLVIM